MSISEFLNAYKLYLMNVKPKSAESYFSYLNSLYNKMPKAKRLLDKIAEENDALKQLEYCVELAEIVYHANKIESKRYLQDGHAAVKKLVDFIYEKSNITFGDKLIERNIHAIWDGEIGLTMELPYNFPIQGEDGETRHIKYAENVTHEQQIQGLCQTLELEYEKILGFARTIFGQWIDTLHPRRIPVILKKECPAKIYLNHDEYVAKKINELIEHREPVTIDKVGKILRHKMRIAGKFFQEPQPHIEIFFRQFDTSCWDEYVAYIAKTLAHEYMHYLEYAYCIEHDSTPFMDKRVSEALADFFGVLYSLKQNERTLNPFRIQVAKENYDAWVEYLGSGWPYANALYFYTLGENKMSFSADILKYEHFGSIQKLINVFHATPNVSKAFDILTN